MAEAAIMETIAGRDIKPLDIIVIRGVRQVVESATPGSNGTFNRLMLVSGTAWPVANNETLIYLGRADLCDVLGIPRSEE